MRDGTSGAEWRLAPRALRLRSLMYLLPTAWLTCAVWIFLQASAQQFDARLAIGVGIASAVPAVWAAVSIIRSGFRITCGEKGALTIFDGAGRTFAFQMKEVRQITLHRRMKQRWYESSCVLYIQSETGEGYECAAGYHPCELRELVDSLHEHLVARGNSVLLVDEFEESSRATSSSKHAVRQCAMSHDRDVVLGRAGYRGGIGEAIAEAGLAYLALITFCVFISVLLAQGPRVFQPLEIFFKLGGAALATASALQIAWLIRVAHVTCGVKRDDDDLVVRSYGIGTRTVPLRAIRYVTLNVRAVGQAELCVLELHAYPRRTLHLMRGMPPSAASAAHEAVLAFLCTHDWGAEGHATTHERGPP